MLSTLFASLIVLSLPAAEPHHFALQAGAPVWDVAVEDVDGDGLRDVVALCAEADSEDRFAAVFPASPAGRFLATPLAQLPLEANAGVAFFAEVDGLAPKELVTANHDGATIYAYRDGAFQEQSRRAFISLLPTGTREPRFLPEAARDLNGDGRDEWLLPAPDGYLVITAGGETIALSCDMGNEMRVYGLPYITHQLPAIRTFSAKGEDTLGIACLSDRYADFFHGDRWSLRERFAVPKSLDDTWDAATRLEDFNGDGLLDLLVSQTKGTVNLEVRTQIYLARELYRYDDTPDTTFSSKGALSTPIVRDVNGDTTGDLVFVTVPFGLRAIANYFLRGKFTVRAEVHLFEDEGGLAVEPSFERTFTLDAPEGREQVAYAMGDFNGDGLMDVAFGSERNTIDFHGGDAKRFLESKPFAEVKAPAFGTARVYIINGAGGEDLVLWHPNSNMRNQIDVVLF